LLVEIKVLYFGKKQTIQTNISKMPPSPEDIRTFGRVGTELVQWLVTVDAVDGWDAGTTAGSAAQRLLAVLAVFSWITQKILFLNKNNLPINKLF
jgi:hypothetical protein